MTNELPKNITIDNTEIDVEDLSPDGQAMVARVVDLRQQLTQANIHRMELETLISSWAQSIKESLKVVDDNPVEVIPADH